jgi:hypothetical protein
MIRSALQASWLKEQTLSSDAKRGESVRKKFVKFSQPLRMNAKRSWLLE